MGACPRSPESFVPQPVESQFFDKTSLNLRVQLLSPSEPTSNKDNSVFKPRTTTSPILESQHTTKSLLDFSRSSQKTMFNSSASDAEKTIKESDLARQLHWVALPIFFIAVAVAMMLLLANRIQRRTVMTKKLIV